MLSPVAGHFDITVPSGDVSWMEEQAIVTSLAVRPLLPADMPGLRHLSVIDTRVDSPPWDQHPRPALAAQAVMSMPLIRRGTRMFVATIDGLVCAAVITRRRAPRYRHDVLSLAASDALLNGSDVDDCRSVWTALLELAIREAGESGAKRLFASAEEGGVAFDGLREASFEPYSRFRVLRLVASCSESTEVPGLRPREESDVWSIHQLYHHVTPPGVQYAEALTSATWERPSTSRFDRVTHRRSAEPAFVVDTVDGVGAYCAVELHGDAAVVRLLVSDTLRHSASDIVMSAARRAGVRDGSLLRVVIPGYVSELGGQFERIGGTIETERVALIRHTTAHAFVRARAVAPLTEVAERAPRRVPNYLQNADGSIVEPCPAVRSRRMERMSN